MMSLKKLYAQDKLQRHKTSRKEINNMFLLIKRDLKDSKLKGLSCDRQFATAYNAVLQSAMILIYCNGYKPRGTGHHFIVFQAMKEILGKTYHDLADYFDACRSKRNTTDYEYAGTISRKEVEELIKEAIKFVKVVSDWLKTHYPQYLKI
ncbi:MAG: hypothetical protein WBB67_14350 [bacterium]